MAGLLNGLDGMLTPHGLITVMTCNDISALDPALIRAGRVDVKELLDYMDYVQFAKLVQVFTGKSWVGTKDIGNKLTPAHVLEQVKRHLDDPDAAHASIAQSLSGNKQV
jgi:ATP-dependent 26S proteasome regulatory subunit